MSIRKERKLLELINQIYLTYGMTLKVPEKLMNEMAQCLESSEPYVIDRAVLPNDIEIRPEKDSNKCVHTEHCCVIHNCKYGDETCPVANRTKRQSSRCQTCNELEEDWYAEQSC